MAALRQLGIVTPVGNNTPGFVGQIFVDEVADVAYVAYGTTSADWQEIGAGGGGGGGFGIVTSVYGDLLDSGGGTVNWDASVGSPLVFKHDQGTATGTILIGAGTLPVGTTQIIHNKMIVMQGGSTGNLVIGISAALVTANYDFLYIDEHAADFSYQANHTIVDPDNQIYVYDVTMHNIAPQHNNGKVGLVMCTKVGQHTISITAAGS